MTVRAVIDFTDAHGHERKKGDTWKMSCEGCAFGLINAGKVIRVISKPKLQRSGFTPSASANANRAKQ